MPTSPSMYVIALRTDAVFRNAGSYESSFAWRSAVARIAPSSIGASKVDPSLPSVILSDSGTTPES